MASSQSGSGRWGRILILVLLAFAVGGCDPAAEPAEAGTAIAVIRFTGDATAAEMRAFFDGFNAGTPAASDTKSFSLRIEERSMVVEFRHRDLDDFEFFTERSSIVAEVTIDRS